MPNLQRQNEKILAACRAGDEKILESLFQELAIDSDHPKNPWDFDKHVPEDQRTPTVHSMLYAAIEGQQIDMVNFLCSKFPKTSFDRGPLAWAVDTGNAQLVEAMCKLDPASADGACHYVNILAYSCSKPENADIVDVLLKSGADPNKPAEHSPPFSNAAYAVSGGMPVSTFEQFFDHGYRFDDRWAIMWAIERDRRDVVEVLFTRGRDLPTARLDSKEELVKMAREKNNLEMVGLIERMYPSRPKRSFVHYLRRILPFRS